MTTTEVPVVTAASTWARRSPPNRRAVMAASTTMQADGQQAGQPQQHQVVPVDLVGQRGPASATSGGLVGVAPGEALDRRRTK